MRVYENKIGRNRWSNQRRVPLWIPGPKRNGTIVILLWYAERNKDETSGLFVRVLMYMHYEYDWDIIRRVCFKCFNANVIALARKKLVLDNLCRVTITSIRSKKKPRATSENFYIHVFLSLDTFKILFITSDVNVLIWKTREQREHWSAQS